MNFTQRMIDEYRFNREALAAILERLCNTDSLKAFEADIQGHKIMAKKGMLHRKSHASIDTTPVTWSVDGESLAFDDLKLFLQYATLKNLRIERGY